MKKTGLVFILGMMVTGCAPQGLEVLDSIAKGTIQDIACQNQKLEEKLWDGLKSYIIEQDQMPSSAALQGAFSREIETLAAQDNSLTDQDIRALKKSFNDLIVTLLDEAPEGERVQTPQELLILLSAIDVGDRTTPFRSYLQNKVQDQFGKVKRQKIKLNQMECSNGLIGPDPSVDPEEDVPTVETPGTESPAEEETDDKATRNWSYHVSEAQRNGVPLAVLGGRWSMATAYQSCQTNQLPSMNSQTSDVRGISVTGKHSDGVGSKRSISSLSQVQTTHYYIKDNSNYGSSCFNVRQNPLIYDYGGKPAATTSTTSTINFFKNAGTGTSVLGVDCSAYVFTAMATAGLRLKEGRTLKASDVFSWGSGTYVEPQQNGLTCLDKISVSPSSTMKAGDIAAVYGHVVMIDKVGTDPFGIASARTTSDCDKVSYKNFNFVVSQSSPSKGAIGLNYFDAKGYLATSSKMATGFEKYAYYTCLAKVSNKTYKPSLGTFSLVRHLGTSACSATRVKLENEACVASCNSMMR